MSEITTERLVLRPLAAADADDVHALWTHEAVRRFLWDGAEIPFARTRAIVEESEALFCERGFGIWGIRGREGGLLVGFVGYWHFRTPPSLELLFGVAAPHWHRGIATEAGRHVVGYGFERLAFRTIEASTDAANVASVRVLEKLGMSLRRRETVGGLDTVFYALTGG